MIYEIPIDTLPNQVLGVSLNNAAYIIELRCVNGLMLAGVEINGQKVVNGAKCLPNQKILPHGHLTRGGNFYFYCLDNEYPHYSKFGRDHKLLFLPNNEIEQLPQMQDQA